MINRVLLRIRIIQVLYSLHQNDGKSPAAAEKELLHSIERAYDLYFHLLNLIVVLTNYAEGRIEARRNKLLPTKEDLNPCTRFIDNKFVKQLAANKQLNDYLKRRKLSWADSRDTVKELYEKIENSDFYQLYQKHNFGDYESDREIWRKIFKTVILGNEHLEEALEDQSLYWADLVEYTIGFVDKTIKYFDQNQGPFQGLQQMLRDEKDLDFSKKLMKNVMDNDEEFQDTINRHTRNWDVERIALMDILILETALGELTDFPTIPVSVTLNEYIEIAKYYSTEKSPTFVNGVLDNIVKELKKLKKLTKVASKEQKKN